MALSVMTEEEKEKHIKEKEKNVKKQYNSFKERTRSDRPPRRSCCSVFKLEVGVNTIIFLDVLVFAFVFIAVVSGKIS